MKVYCCPSIDFSCPYYRDHYMTRGGETEIGICGCQNPPEECDSFAMILEEELDDYVVEEI